MGFKTTIVKTQVLNVDVNRVFSFISDFSNTHLWHPSVVKSNRIGSSNNGLQPGVQFHIVTVRNGKFNEMVYTINKIINNFVLIINGEDNRVKTTDTIMFRSLGANQTEVKYQVEVTLKGWKKPISSMLQSTFNEIGDHAMRGMANYFKTGSKLGIESS